MKMKRRIAVGAAAMAAAVTLGSCSSGTQADKAGTQIESTAEGTSEDTTQGAGSQSTESAAASVSEISAEGITEIDIFVEEHNYNPVVYGPPEER
jgi:ABC-type glycerol-3-phosphate transport system substrate-binding protein